MTGLTCARDPSRGPYALGGGGGHDGASAFEERHEKTPPSWWPGAVTAAEHGAQREASESSRRSGDGTLEAGTPRRRPEPQGGWRGTGGGSGAVETGWEQGGVRAGRQEDGTGPRPCPRGSGRPAARAPRAPAPLSAGCARGRFFAGPRSQRPTRRPLAGPAEPCRLRPGPRGGPRRACGIFPRRTQKSRIGNE